MFAIIKDNQIAMMVADGTAFEYDDVQYPQNWTNLSTPEEKAAIGVVDVVYAERPSDLYYWVSQDAPVYADGVVTIGYTATPKDFAMCQASEITKIKDATFSLLAPTDYIDTRNLRDPNYKVDWMLWRESVLTACREQVAVVEACTTVDELAVLPAVQFPHDPNYVEISQ